jgi:hypothetical protein
MDEDFREEESESVVLLLAKLFFLIFVPNYWGSKPSQSSSPINDGFSFPITEGLSRHKVCPQLLNFRPQLLRV